MLLSPDTLRKLLETADKPEVEMDSSQFTKEVRGGKVHYRLREGEPGSAPGGGFRHMWKATRKEGLSVKVRGGTFTTQEGFGLIAVADLDELETPETGTIVLSISRNESTRAIEGTPVILFDAGDALASGYATQYIPLAKVTVEDDVITEIIPLQVQELHIFEDLAVVNGEFRLASLLMSSRSIYVTPDDSSI